MTSLSGPRAEAKSGETKSLVVLLHGYGADGNDLFGLSGPLSQYLPDTVFRAPNAPEPCRVNPMGYQWFPIPWLDGSGEDEMVESFTKSAAILDDYLSTAMEEEGVGPAETVLIGFSQGTMMSLHVAPRRAEPVAGIVGFSGRLLAPERLAGEAKTKPPVLLVHGDQDEMIPVAELDTARAGLAEAGFQVTAHVSQGIGHGIAPDGLGLALQFIRLQLGLGDLSGAGAET